MISISRFDNPFTLSFTLGAMERSELPGACVGCGECSRACPQGIDVPDVMDKFARWLVKR